MEKVISEREKWFKKNTGRRIFRTAIPNSSPADEIVYNTGQLIYNREHAVYLFQREKEFKLAGTPVLYFSSKTDRDDASPLIEERLGQ